MKPYILLLLFLGLLGCSSRESESPVIYKTIVIQEDHLRYKFQIFDTDDLSQPPPDHTIIVDDISNFILTGADLNESSFSDLHIRMLDY
tara:strand:+ start:756 stop:1022 length:267 start_codon:yes stop_codon:yes gene_type:complete